MDTTEEIGERRARSARWLLAAAAVLWSTSGLLAKNAPMEAIPQEHRGPLLACYRALFAAACLLPFVSWKRVRLRRAHVPAVLCYTLMNVAFVTSLTRTTAAAAIFLQYTSTAWVFLLGWWLLREPISRVNLVPLGCAIAGIGVIVANDWNGERLVGNLLAVLSGAAYAGVVLTLRVLRDEDAAWIVMLNNLGAGLALLPWALTRPVELTGMQWSLATAMGILQMGIPYILFARAVRHVPAQEANLITILEAVLNPALVWLFLGETAPRSTWVGGGLILAGLVLRYTVLARRPAIPAVNAGPPE